MKLAMKAGMETSSREMTRTMALHYPFPPRFETTLKIMLKTVLNMNVTRLSWTAIGKVWVTLLRIGRLVKALLKPRASVPPRQTKHRMTNGRLRRHLVWTRVVMVLPMGPLLNTVPMGLFGRVKIRVQIRSAALRIMGTTRRTCCRRHPFTWPSSTLQIG